MTIEEEQAAAIRDAMKRADTTDLETLEDIIRICRHSHCAVCKVIHALAIERTGLDESGMPRAQGG